MKCTRIWIAALILLLTIACLPVTAAEPIGGNQGWLSVHCNVDGAQVYFDGKYQGEITGGILTIAVYSTGTPYKSYIVSKSGYNTYTGSIPYMPGIGETENLFATLNPVVPTTQAVIGGNQGWYTVNCNVNGATVMFDNQVVGTITQGTLTVPVYTTGTPYKTYTVSMNGYLPYTAPMPSVPAAGQTVTLYATLNLAPATSPVPAPTKSPLPIWILLIGIGIAGTLAVRNMRN
ncbi:hypothetical protein [Methanoregula sp.]|uniref:hypothetical protein n=1 Tax=Methanoregula sp. TaxID=2052170 RepID=UPI00356A8DE2